MADNERNLPVLNDGGKERTAAGNYFISNYPPYSFWDGDQVPRVEEKLDGAVAPGTKLGVYVHIPFCRKRCDFCYFKVYTDKNSTQIRSYIDAVIAETERLASRPYLQGREPDFVYFGGGTPSYLSVEQLSGLFEGLQRHLPWTSVQEVSFECEPGTLQEKKIHALREMGVTRLSLGVENFNPEILERNNRAHRAKEIHRAFGFARDAGFDQINIDLIAGMIGETDENWAECIEETIALDPDSVTIYQMEVPYNTTIYQRMKQDNEKAAPIADWETKRRWVRDAFDRLEEAGFRIGSAYTASKPESAFVYRDALWSGADMLGVGVSSISHLGGVNYQNEHQFDPYVQRVEAGDLPIKRAFELSNEERFIREFILQLKLGRNPLEQYRERFGIDPTSRYAVQLGELERRGVLRVDGDAIHLDRWGLLQVDGLLPEFYLDHHKDARYA